MVDTTDNRGPNMKHIMDDIQNTLCHDMMSWDELADRCLELETELQTAKEHIKVLESDIQEENDKLSLRAFNKLKQHIQLECDRISQAYRIEFENTATLNERIKVLAEALKLSQFGFNHRRCPVCAGWNMSENGETDMIHRKDCKISIALAAVKEE